MKAEQNYHRVGRGLKNGKEEGQKMRTGRVEGVGRIVNDLYVVL